MQRAHSHTRRTKLMCANMHHACAQTRSLMCSRSKHAQGSSIARGLSIARGSSIVRTEDTSVDARRCAPAKTQNCETRQNILRTHAGFCVRPFETDSLQRAASISITPFMTRTITLDSTRSFASLQFCVFAGAQRLASTQSVFLVARTIAIQTQFSELAVLRLCGRSALRQRSQFFL
jgi:hypothetical protein